MARKRIGKQYNEQDDMGIYGLYCEATGRWYVGASKHLKARTRKHILDLQNPSRPHAMSEDARKYGPESIKLFILEKILDKSKLAARERYWIERKDALNNGYNRMPSGRSGGWF